MELVRISETAVSVSAPPMKDRADLSCVEYQKTCTPPSEGLTTLFSWFKDLLNRL